MTKPAIAAEMRLKDLSPEADMLVRFLVREWLKQTPGGRHITKMMRGKARAAKALTKLLDLGLAHFCNDGDQWWVEVSDEGAAAALFNVAPKGHA